MEKLSAVCVPDHERYWRSPVYDAAGNLREDVRGPYRYAALMFGNTLDGGYGYDFTSIEGYATDDPADLRGLVACWQEDIDAGIIEVWDFENRRFIDLIDGPELDG